jgi:hypothetical protein
MCSLAGVDQAFITTCCLTSSSASIKCTSGSSAVISGFPVIRPRSATTVRHIVTNLTIHIRVGLLMHFSELAVFDSRLDIRVRRIDEPA